MGTGEGGTFATREYAGDEREREREKERRRERKKKREKERDREIERREWDRRRCRGGHKGIEGQDRIQGGWDAKG